MSSPRKLCTTSLTNVHPKTNILGLTLRTKCQITGLSSQSPSQTLCMTSSSPKNGNNLATFLTTSLIDTKLTIVASFTSVFLPHCFFCRNRREGKTEYTNSKSGGTVVVLCFEYRCVFWLKTVLFSLMLGEFNGSWLSTLCLYPIIGTKYLLV